MIYRESGFKIYYTVNRVIKVTFIIFSFSFHHTDFIYLISLSFNQSIRWILLYFMIYISCTPSSHSFNSHIHIAIFHPIFYLHAPLCSCNKVRSVRVYIEATNQNFLLRSKWTRASLHTPAAETSRQSPNDRNPEVLNMFQYKIQKNSFFHSALSVTLRYFFSTVGHQFNTRFWNWLLAQSCIIKLSGLEAIRLLARKSDD